MNLSELITSERLVIGLRAADKGRALAALAKQAATQTAVSDQAIFASLCARENLGSTGLGRGFALPHARVEGVHRLFGFFARLARPIDFGSIDGAPVDLVFLLLIPPGAGSEHVAALAAIARHMRDDALLSKLREANSVSALMERLTTSLPK